MAFDKSATAIWKRQIKDILNRDWDPIGGCPEDEYDAYAGKIAAMIREGVSNDGLMSYLEWAEAEHMGFGRFNTERGRRVIAALRMLGFVQ